MRQIGLLSLLVRQEHQDLIFGYAPVVDHPDTASLAGSGQIPSNLPNSTCVLDDIAGVGVIGQILLKLSVGLVRHQSLDVFLEHWGFNENHMPESTPTVYCVNGVVAEQARRTVVRAPS